MMEIHVEFFFGEIYRAEGWIPLSSLSFLLAVFAYYHRNRFIEDIFNAFFSVVLKYCLGLDKEIEIV